MPPTDSSPPARPLSFTEVRRIFGTALAVAEARSAEALARCESSDLPVDDETYALVLALDALGLRILAAADYSRRTSDR